MNSPEVLPSPNPDADSDRLFKRRLLRLPASLVCHVTSSPCSLLPLQPFLSPPTSISFSSGFGTSPCPTLPKGALAPHKCRLESAVRPQFAQNPRGLNFLRPSLNWAIVACSADPVSAIKALPGSGTVKYGQSSTCALARPSQSMSSAAFPARPSSPSLASLHPTQNRQVPLLQSSVVKLDSAHGVFRLHLRS